MTKSKATANFVRLMDTIDQNVENAQLAAFVKSKATPKKSALRKRKQARQKATITILEKLRKDRRLATEVRLVNKTKQESASNVARKITGQINVRKESTPSMCRSRTHLYKWSNLQKSIVLSPL